MLRRNEFKAALGAAERPLVGLINSVPAPLLVEMLGYAGYDFVVIDQEHAAPNPETLENLIRAAECSGVTPLVRMPGAASDAILHALDAGAQGVVIPHVRNADEARAAVRASRYHPLGERGISGGRTTGFGSLTLPDYFSLANAEILVAVMIEDREGVEAIDEIVAVPGVDLVIEGAIDLSQSYGAPAQAQHPDVLTAVAHVAACCRAAGVAFCAVPRVDGQLDAWLERGVHTFLIGDDRGVAFGALKAHAAGLRQRAGRRRA
ncbi:HpcH/HpaI aldolase/citrate lyase family protein [Methylosinus sp. KRF6]|uniref:HpcH/HpaI aldolase family protein n=1 Tax=Methylosinus sp. KRF6 TaxID=2846853 RepID=UPI001C0C9C58|nr:aldolase/citrate lyase family protein [Methylosinus sp. KRF6]MBU3891045.1 siderophore biosynthesis protein SbnG [Methylosinus sp. KRF6]